MADSVGTIEVTVEADTGRLKATMVKDGIEAGRATHEAIKKQLDDIEASIELNDEDVKLKAKLLRKQIEQSVKDIEGTLDLKINTHQARRELEQFEQHVEAQKLAMEAAIPEKEFAAITARLDKFREENDLLEIEAQINLAEVNARLEKFVKDAERKELDLSVDADFTDIDASLEAWRMKNEHETVNIPADWDHGDLEKMTLRLHQMSWEQTVNFEADLAGINASIALFREKQQLNDIEIPVHMDQKQLDSLNLRLHQWANKAGDDAGQQFGKSFGGGMSGDNTKIILMIVGAIGDAAAGALSGAVAAATSVISSAVVALGAAAGAAIPLVAGLGGALAAIVVGSAGVVGALGAVNAEMKEAVETGRDFNFQAEGIQSTMAGLSPEAQQVVRAFAGIRTELGEANKEIQNALFDDFSFVMEDLAKSVLPSVTASLVDAGTSVNEFGKQIALVAEDTDFEGMFKAVKPAVDEVFDAITDVVAAFEPFIKAAAPAAEELARWLHIGAESLREWVTNNPTELTDTLLGGIDSLEEWGRLLDRISGLLITVFDSGKESGDGFVSTLGTIVEHWDQFLESTEGQTALADFFDSGRATIEALRPIVDGIRDAIENMVSDSASENFEELALAVGNAIRVLGELLTVMGEAGLLTAIITIVTAFEPFLQLIGMIPDAGMELIGFIVAMGTVAGAAFSKVASMAQAVVELTVSLKGLLVAHPYLMLTIAAMTAALLVWQSFSDANKQVEDRSRQLKGALDGVADALVREEGAADDATLGLQALNETLAGSGEDGDKLTKSLGALGLTTEDATEKFLAMEQDSKGALTQIGIDMDLTVEQAEKLAAAVDSSDDSFTVMTKALDALSGETKLTDAELTSMALAMEELQDQQEKTDFKEVIGNEFELALGADEASRAMAEQALAGQDLAKMTDAELVEAYNKLLKIQAEALLTTEEGTAANEAYGRSHDLVEQAITDAVDAQRLMNEELVKTGQDAYEAAKAEERLRDKTADVASVMATNMGVPQELADKLIAIGRAADDATAASEALSSTFDVLFGNSITASQTFDDFTRMLQETTESLKGTGEEGEDTFTKVSSGLEAIFGTTEAALTFRDTMREGASAMFDFAAQSIETGASAETVNAGLETMRTGLIDLATQFGVSEEDASAYIDTLMGTPEFMKTIVEQPGIFDALLNAEDLTLLYNEAGEPVDTEFETLGLDSAIGDSETFKGIVDSLNGLKSDTTIESTTVAPTQEQIDQALETTGELDDASANPDFKATTLPAVQRQVDTLLEDLTTLDTTTANPIITLPNVTKRAEEIGGLTTDIETLDALNPSVTVALPGITTRTDEVQDLIDTIARLVNKNVTITTTNVSKNIGGLMAGGIVGHDQVVRVGERGLSEAVIPLQLPLSRVDPSVRAMAELLRGNSRTGITSASTVPSTMMTNNWTINEVGDGQATAQKVMNRLAASAV